MIGYELATKRPGDTELHRVRKPTPAWSLCGVFCVTRPQLSAQASPTFCATCVRIEREEDEADDRRGDDGPYSAIADSYMRRPDR